jgi:hypothetical protein
MRVCVASLLVVLMVVSGMAGVVGVFQGRIVEPRGARKEPGVLYIEGRSGMARRVQIGDAKIEYDEEVPPRQRRKVAAQSLCPDALVRITAEQSDEETGDWKAIDILILPEPRSEKASLVSASAKSGCAR